MTPSDAAARRVRLAAFAVIAICYAVLLAIIVTSPAHIVYDEGWYLDTTTLLQRHGLSIAFLRELPGPAGPTFTFVYAAAKALIGDTLPWLRLVGVVFLLACSALLAALLATLEGRAPDADARATRLLKAAMFVALPTVAASSGMTLTEIPAMACVLVATLTLAINERRGSVLACAIAGLGFGAAILGRQNYLVILGCLALLIDWRDFRASFGRLFVTGAVALLICGPVFAIWRGLVPPPSAQFTAKLHPWFLVLSFGYLALIALIVEPRVFRPLLRVRALIAVVAVAIALAAVFAQPQVPARTALSFLPPAALDVVGWGFAGAIALLATAFLAAMAVHLMDARADRFALFLGGAVLLCMVTNIQAEQFSSRYVFVALPFLLLLLAPRMRLAWDLPLRLAIGGAMGLASLASYFA